MSEETCLDAPAPPVKSGWLNLVHNAAKKVVLIVLVVVVSRSWTKTRPTCAGLIYVQFADLGG